MNNSDGQFRSTLHRVGGLGAANLQHCAEFVRDDNLYIPVGAGNKVTLFVNNDVAETSTDVATLDAYGIIPCWSFYDRPLLDRQKKIARTVDYGGEPPITDFFRLTTWTQPLITDNTASATSDDTDYHEMKHQAFTLPKETEIWPSVPGGAGYGDKQFAFQVTAMADYLRVFFYLAARFAFPGFQPGDLIEVYAMVGHNAQ